MIIKSRSSLCPNIQHNYFEAIKHNPWELSPMEIELSIYEVDRGLEDCDIIVLAKCLCQMSILPRKLIEVGDNTGFKSMALTHTVIDLLPSYRFIRLTSLPF